MNLIYRQEILAYGAQLQSVGEKNESNEKSLCTKRATVFLPCFKHKMGYEQ